MLTIGGRALKSRGPTPGYQLLSNYEYRWEKYRSQAVGDKLHCQEGKSPDYRLRSLNMTKWKEGSGLTETIGMLA